MHEKKKKRAAVVELSKRGHVNTTFAAAKCTLAYRFSLLDYLDDGLIFPRTHLSNVRRRMPARSSRTEFSVARCRCEVLVRAARLVSKLIRISKLSTGSGCNVSILLYLDRVRTGRRSI